MASRVVIAVAALVRDGSVLLVHRHPARLNYPNCWDLVGGHVEPGEPAEQAVRRECLEEVGVEVLDPVRITMSMPDAAVDLRAFLVTRGDGEPVNAAPHEHDDLRWCRTEDLAGLSMANPAGVPDLVRAVRSTR